MMADLGIFSSLTYMSGMESMFHRNDQKYAQTFHSFYTFWKVSFARRCGEFVNTMPRRPSF